MLHGSGVVRVRGTGPGTWNVSLYESGTMTRESKTWVDMRIPFIAIFLENIMHICYFIYGLVIVL